MSAQGFSSTEVAHRWPHIDRFLRVDDSTGLVIDDYRWFIGIEDQLTPAERASSFEEWADFYEWRLERRDATTRVEQHLVAQWTDSMAYSCRRCAAFARGEDPGEWVPQSTRRPDLEAAMTG